MLALLCHTILWKTKFLKKSYPMARVFNIEVTFAPVLLIEKFFFKIFLSTRLELETLKKYYSLNFTSNKSTYVHRINALENNQYLVHNQLVVLNQSKLRSSRSQFYERKQNISNHFKDDVSDLFEQLQRSQHRQYEEYLMLTPISQVRIQYKSFLRKTY